MMKIATYQCLKGDETTYLLHYQVSDEGERRRSHTFVIDLENMLVTRIIAQLGTNPKYPYLVKTEIEFGAIFEEGKDLPFKRHGYTSDMIGNAIKWTYGSEMARIHIYYCGNYYRITDPSDKPPLYGNKEFLTEMPSSDEPTAYIKIKDGVYLFSLTEINMEKILGERMVYRCNTMCMLQNYKRVYQVGRAFGTRTIDGNDEEVNYMLTAYGEHVEVDPHFFTDPNPYLV
jgi:hypothetical protein